MRSLWEVTAGRVAIYFICAVLAAYLVWVVRERARAPSAPTATRALMFNDKIMPGDLQTKDTASLMGHYLRRHVDAGGLVTAAIVSDQQLMPTLPNSLAVIVAMSADTLSTRQIDKGTPVLIMRGVQTLGEGTVIATQCDPQACAVIVGLAKQPAFDPAALAGADLVPIPVSPPPVP